MTRNMWKVVVVALMALLPVAANAQDVNHRQAEQHARIRQGIQSGALTHHEAHKIIHKEAKIRAQEARDRARHGGHLTPGERSRINHELSHASHEIRHDKHNGWHRP